MDFVVEGKKKKSLYPQGVVRSVAPAHFFSSKVGKGTVAYLLNQGYCNAHCSHCYMSSLKTSAMKRSISQAWEDITKLLDGGYRIILRGHRNSSSSGILPSFSLGWSELPTN